MGTNSLRRDSYRGGSEHATIGVGRESAEVLVVDDNAAFRRALARVVEAAGYVLIGEAETGEEAIEMTHARSPQVVLMDIRMPGINGIEAAQRIAALQPEVTVVLMTVTVDDALGEELAKSGLECVRKELIRPNTLRDLITAAKGHHDHDRTAS